jgi:hypothetical protein
MMLKASGRTFGFFAVVSMCMVAGPLVGTSFADEVGTSSGAGQVTATSSPGQVTATSSPGQVTATSSPGQVTATSSPGQVQAAAAVVVVSPSAMNGWAFVNDATNAPETGTFVTGPATPPLSTGSVQLATPTAADAHMIATQAYASTPLSAITNLDYWTFQSGPPSPLAISLQFDIRYRLTDTSYGGRLVFEPYQNGAVTVGSGWQHWDALNGGNALWWTSKTTANGADTTTCQQSSPCTWNKVLTLFPGAEILPGGNLLLKAGSNWAGFTGDADALTVGVRGSNTTYDFNPDVAVVTPPGGGVGGGTPTAGGITVGGATVALGGTSTFFTPAGSGAGTVTLGGPSANTSPIPPVQVKGKQAIRKPAKHQQAASTHSSGSTGWLWWLLVLVGIAFAAFLWIAFTRSRSASA